jgi:hypothetical protein
MKRRALKPIFVDGVLRAKGEVFETTKAWKYTEDADRPAKKDPDKPKDFDRKGVMAELTAAGVEFRGNASNESLAEMLAEVKAAMAPASPTAPPKESGTGDQDVI